MIIIRTIIAVCRIILLIIPMGIFIGTYLLLVKLGLENTPSRAFKLRRLYLHYTNFILGIHTDCKGSMHKSTALYVSNHRSLSDPLILCKYLDAFIIAKAEVSQYPLISTGASLTGILYVKRDNKESRSEVREKMKETLLSNNNVLVYPEGTVNCHKNTLPYRPGTFSEVLDLGIPVVPVCIEYKNKKDVWCNRTMIKHFFLQFGYLFTHCRVIIGTPVIAEDGESLKNKVESWTNEQIKAIHSDWKSHFNHSETVEEQI